MKTQVNCTLNDDRPTTRFRLLSVGDFFYYDTDTTFSVLYQKITESPFLQYICISTGDLYTLDPKAFDPKVYKVKSVDIRVTL